LFEQAILKDKENWILVLKNSARRDFFACGFNENTILGPTKNFLTTLNYAGRQGLVT
jgi:hypothetical protein